MLTAADVSPVVKRLGDLLGADRPPSLLEDTSLVLSPVTSSQLVPVNSSTPTPNSALLAEIGRLKAEVRAKTYELYTEKPVHTSLSIMLLPYVSLCVCVCCVCVLCVAVTERGGSGPSTGEGGRCTDSGG